MSPVALIIVLAKMVGALAGVYLILRLLMFGCRKLRQKPNGAREIALMGLLTWTLSTVIGGYGIKDGGPEPLFYQAFLNNYGPVMGVTVIELVRLAGRKS